MTREITFTLKTQGFPNRKLEGLTDTSVTVDSHVEILRGDIILESNPDTVGKVVDGLLSKAKSYGNSDYTLVIQVGYID